jgi:hypothetical protein
VRRGAVPEPGFGVSRHREPVHEVD